MSSTLSTGRARRAFGTEMSTNTPTNGSSKKPSAAVQATVEKAVKNLFRLSIKNSAKKSARKSSSKKKSGSKSSSSKKLSDAAAPAASSSTSTPILASTETPVSIDEPEVARELNLSEHKPVPKVGGVQSVGEMHSVKRKLDVSSSVSHSTEEAPFKTATDDRRAKQAKGPSRIARHRFRMASGPSFKGFRRMRSNSHDEIENPVQSLSQASKSRFAQLLRKRLTSGVSMSSKSNGAGGKSANVDAVEEGDLLPYPPGFTPPMVKKARGSSEAAEAQPTGATPQEITKTTTTTTKTTTTLTETTTTVTSATPPFSSSTFGSVTSSSTKATSMITKIGTPEPEELRALQLFKAKAASKNLPAGVHPRLVGAFAKNSSTTSIAAPPGIATALSAAKAHRHKLEAVRARQKKIQEAIREKELQRSPLLVMAAASDVEGLDIGTPECDDLLVEAVKRGKSMSRLLKNKGLAAHKAAHAAFQRRTRSKAEHRALRQLAKPTNEDKENVDVGHTAPKQPIRRCHAFAEVSTSSSTDEAEAVGQVAFSTTQEYTSSSNYSSAQYSEFLATLQTSKGVAGDTKQSVEEEEAAAEVKSEQAGEPADDVENVAPKDFLPSKVFPAVQVQKPKPSLRSLAVQRGTTTRSRKSKSQKQQQRQQRQQREQQREQALQQFLTKVNSTATSTDEGSAGEVQSVSTAVQASPETISAATTTGEELVKTESESAEVTLSEDLSLLSIVNAAAIFVVLCAGAIMFWTA